MDVSLKFYEADSGTVVEQFGQEEAAQLSKYVTNTDSTVFAWKLGDELSPEQAGALLSRYSRTAFTGRQLFLKEFLPNKNRGKEFFEAWLVDYGDDSIQEMAGGLPVSCEFISNVMAKEIEDCRLGSYIEKSTRYVAFDKKLPNGEYMYYKEPAIMSSRFGDRYIGLMNSLFDCYAKHMDAMQHYIEEINPIDTQTFRIGDTGIKLSQLTAQIEQQYGFTEKDIRRAYANSVKANALDQLRDLLPMSTLTHVGISMNARSYENLITKLSASQYAEGHMLAKSIHAELSKITPSLIRRAFESHGLEMQGYIRKRDGDVAGFVSQIMQNQHIGNNDADVELVNYTGKSEQPDWQAQVAVAAALIYRYSEGFSLEQATVRAAELPEQQRLELIAKAVGERSNRRQKPGREFENIEYQFGLRGRVGIYRDIQRHRIGTQQRQNFSVRSGYETREEFKLIGIDKEYKALMSEVIGLYEDVHATMPQQAQYITTFGFNARWSYRFNARQLFHLCELRTTPAGHPDYRKLVQEMYKEVQRVHPSISRHLNFINMSDKQLGRLESEVRIVAKRAKIANTS